jgi:ubiquitin-conjugating enzyme E2 J2
MKPPGFKVLTPSGRFEPGVRLCMSMSDYHPESWNPSWSVETLLVGLLSFMYEESNAIGSIEASAAQRVLLAAASRAYVVGRVVTMSQYYIQCVARLTFTQRNDKFHRVYR